MTRTTFRYADEADIAVIAADARQADIDEMAALGTTVEAALRRGLATSNWSATGLVDGVPAAMWGVSPGNVLAGIGSPWLLTSERVLHVEGRVFWAARSAIRAMLDCYPRLTNVVDERNVLAIKFLGLLGFEFSLEAIPYNGHNFRAFRTGDW